MNQTEIERLRQERDLALNTAMGAVAERDAAYAAVTRANRERDEARAEVERLKGYNESLLAAKEDNIREVARLTRERDALQSQFDRMSAVADEFRHQRDRAYEESAAIGVALDETRAAALEEAAGIAAGFMRPTEGRIIAAAIRAARPLPHAAQGSDR